jgi:hypothetical protein
MYCKPFLSIQLTFPGPIPSAKSNHLLLLLLNNNSILGHQKAVKWIVLVHIRMEYTLWEMGTSIPQLPSSYKVKKSEGEGG